MYTPLEYERFMTLFCSFFMCFSLSTSAYWWLIIGNSLATYHISPHILIQLLTKYFNIFTFSFYVYF